MYGVQAAAARRWPARPARMARELHDVIGHHMSLAAARTHVSRAMTKLGARDRTRLAVRAYETGLVRPGWLA